MTPKEAQHKYLDEVDHRIYLWSAAERCVEDVRLFVARRRGGIVNADDILGILNNHGFSGNPLRN